MTTVVREVHISSASWRRIMKAITDAHGPAAIATFATNKRYGFIRRHVSGFVDGKMNENGIALDVVDELKFMVFHLTFYDLIEEVSFARIKRT